MFETKAWGRVAHAFMNDQVGVSYLELKENKRSSWHCHRVRTNSFVVIEGTVVIEEIDEEGDVVRTTLRAGDKYSVYVDIMHRFRVIEDAKMIEVYLPVMPHGEADIERADQGGDDHIAMEDLEL